MSQNPGWLHRVFGTREIDEALAAARAQLAARDHRIAELEQQLAGSPEASGAGERERELAERLALAIADRTTLGAELAEVQKRLLAHESALASEVERATTLGKAATAANRRAEQRMLELQTLEKQRAEAESNAAAAKAALEQLEAISAGRERELASKGDALTTAEWKIETLERELEQARAEVQRAKGQQQTLAALQRELASQRAEREQQDRALVEARAAEAHLSVELSSLTERDAAARAALRRVIELSAHGLWRTLGAAAHLALELGAEQASAWRLPDADEHEQVQKLCEHLALLGVADELSLRQEGDRVEGRFVVRATDERDAAPLARWIAAYAIEVWAASGHPALRLETLSGGPSEYRFRADPRAVPARPRPLSAGVRDTGLDVGLQPSES